MTKPWETIRVDPREPRYRCGECEACRWGRGQACELDPRRREQLESDGHLRRLNPDGTWERVGG
jgi:hypothetical protein